MSFSSQNQPSTYYSPISFYTSLIRVFGIIVTLSFGNNTLLYSINSPLSSPYSIHHIEDDYIVNKKGEIELYQETDDDFDRLILVENKKGVVHYDKNNALINTNIEIEKGILSNITALQKEYQGKVFNGTKLDFNNQETEANRVFEFLSDNVYVEWAIVNFETKEATRVHIYTSHLRDLELFGAAYTLTLSMSPTIRSIKHCHSHPRTPWEDVGKYAFPSEEDLQFRNEIQNSDVEFLEFTIRTDGLYIDYGSDNYFAI